MLLVLFRAYTDLLLAALLRYLLKHLCIFLWSCYIITIMHLTWFPLVYTGMSFVIDVLSSLLEFLFRFSKGFASRLFVVIIGYACRLNLMFLLFLFVFMHRYVTTIISMVVIMNTEPTVGSYSPFINSSIALVFPRWCSASLILSIISFLSILVALSYSVPFINSIFSISCIIFIKSFFFNLLLLFIIVVHNSVFISCWFISFVILNLFGFIRIFASCIGSPRNVVSGVCSVQY